MSRVSEQPEKTFAFRCWGCGEERRWTYDEWRAKHDHYVNYHKVGICDCDYDGYWCPGFSFCGEFVGIDPTEWEDTA